ncbi:unnamed protein product [Discosporangium mesarthrocarpum]
MFAWGWAYRRFSALGRREAEAMVPVKAFASGLLRGASLLDSRGSSGGSNGNPSQGLGSPSSPQLSQGGRGLGARVRAGAGEEIRQQNGGGGGGGGGEEGGVRGCRLHELGRRESHAKDPKSMVDETITLLFAGQDTSAATLSWAMHLLSLPRHRHHLLRIRAEVEEACGGSGGGSSHIPGKAVGQMTFVSACIKEAQRLYPVAPFIVRSVESDLRLKDGTLIPAGTVAVVWIYGLHRHPGLWEQPDEFVPQRWMMPRAGAGAGGGAGNGEGAAVGGRQTAIKVGRKGCQLVLELAVELRALVLPPQYNFYQYTLYQYTLLPVYFAPNVPCEGTLKEMSAEKGWSWNVGQAFWCAGGPRWSGWDGICALTQCLVRFLAIGLVRMALQQVCGNTVLACASSPGSFFFEGMY